MVCFSFFFFRFSLFVFHFSFFVIRFLLFRYSNDYWFFAFLFSFFDIKNRAEYGILTFKLRPNIVFLHSKYYFDIRIGDEYRILIFKILYSNLGRISYFDIQNPILTFKLRPNIVF